MPAGVAHSITNLEPPGGPLLYLSSCTDGVFDKDNPETDANGWDVADFEAAVDQAAVEREAAAEAAALQAGPGSRREGPGGAGLAGLFPRRAGGDPGAAGLGQAKGS